MNEPKNGSSKLFIGRVVFVSCLALMAIVLGLGSYVVLENSERELAEIQFESLADSILQHAQLSTTRRRRGIIAMASVVSFSKPNADEWPYVMVDGFDKVSSEIIKASLGGSMVFAPLVQPDQLSKYNDFAYEYLEANYPPGAGVTSAGRGVWGADRDSRLSAYLEVDGVTHWGSPYNTLTPIIQGTGRGGEVRSTIPLMRNMHASQEEGVAIDQVFACAEERHKRNDESIECGTMATSTAQRSTVSYLVHPIYPASNSTVLTGIVKSSVTWTDLIADSVLLSNMEGLCVLSSEFSVVTFRISNGIIERVGLIGDMHSSKYDKYARSASLTDALPVSNSSETYTLTLYPNDEFFSSYSTSNPWIAAIGSACIVLSTSLLFFLYDCLMREEVGKRRGLLDSKRKFVRFVSHEVRTPLNAVCMGLSLLLEDLTAKFPQAMLQQMKDEDSSKGGVGINSSFGISSRKPSYSIATYPTGTAHCSNEPPVQVVAAATRRRQQLSQRTMSGGSEKVRGNVTAAAGFCRGGSGSDKDGGGTATTAAAAASASDWIQLTSEILDSAQSAVDVLNDVLDYDKIQIGKLTLDETIVPIWSLIERTVNEFGLQSLKAKVSVQMDFSVIFPEDGGTHTRYHDTTAVTAAADSSSSSSSSSSANYSGSGRRVLPSSQTEQQQQSLVLEPAAHERMVIGDSLRLSQVIRNLVSNALKFTPENGKVVVSGEWLRDRKEVEVEEGGNRSSGNHKNGLTHFTLNTGDECDFARSGLLKLMVKDTGAGIFPDKVQKLFGEGVQFNVNTLQAGGGSGLGLCIAKGIVEHHGGSLTVASEGLGLGTTFTLMLPLYHVPDSALPAGFENVPQTSISRRLSTTSMEVSGATRRSLNPTGRGGSVVVALRSLHVLVVDDVKSNLKMLTRSLKNKQHDCVQAKHGQEAIDKYVASLEPGARPFDAILMDFEMPVMNGPDATKVIRGLGCECVIVGVTGNVLPEDVNYFKSMGANDVLPKPLKIPELERVWRKHGLHSTAQNGAGAGAGAGREGSTNTTSMQEVVTYVEAFAPPSGEEMV